MYKECREINAGTIGKFLGQEILVKTEEKGRRELVGILKEAKRGSLVMYARSVFVRSSELQSAGQREEDIVEVRYAKRVELPFKSITDLQVYSKLIHC